MEAGGTKTAEHDNTMILAGPGADRAASVVSNLLIIKKKETGPRAAELV